MEPDRRVRLQVMLSENELSAIDDFRFDHRLPSRAAAFRLLLRTGLTVSDGLQTSEPKSSQKH
nr:hypothetical protein [Bradyrhizobium lablabi]